MDMPLALLNRRRRGGASFEKTLFSVPGSRGFFYDFSDYNTQFTDTAGTTAITGVGQSLARVNDKSGLGNHATQATAGSRALTQVRPMFTQRNRAVGSELVENTFYWPASAVQNGITMTKIASGTDTDGLPYVDVRYQGTSTGTSHEGVYPTASSRTAGAAGNQFTASVICRLVGGSLTGVSGLRTFVVEETAPSTFIGITLSALASSASDTQILATRTLSTGNQARTAVSLEFTSGATIDITYRIKGLQLELGSARTTYQPAVSGELRNLTLNSGRPDLWNGGIGLSNGITVTRVASGVDTDGLPYGDFNVSGTATTNEFRAIVGISETRRAATVGQTFTSAIVVRLISGTAPPVGNGVFSEVTEENSSFAYLVGTGSTTNVPATDTLRVATRTLSDPAVAFTRGGAIIGTLSGTTVNYTVRIKGVQFEQASTYSRYQRTITANEWYEPGFTSYRGIRFDGSDDFLQTAAIDFSNSDKMTVVAGVRKLSDADAALVELTASTNVYNGAFGLFANAPVGPGIYQVLSRGTTLAARNLTQVAPDTAVLTALCDISAPSLALKRNGITVTTAASQGTGNFANDIVYIGRRGGTTLPFNGVLTFLCVINRTLTAGELAQLEAFANSRTGAY